MVVRKFLQRFFEFPSVPKAHFAVVSSRDDLMRLVRVEVYIAHEQTMSLLDSKRRSNSVSEHIIIIIGYWERGRDK
jgi:hypothetical protein